MSEQALRDEVQTLREHVARLEATRPADMDGFRQLNDAIVNNRLGAFIQEKGQPRWLRIGVPAILLPAAIIFIVIVILV